MERFFSVHEIPGARVLFCTEYNVDSSHFEYEEWSNDRANLYAVFPGIPAQPTHPGDTQKQLCYIVDHNPYCGYKEMTKNS